MRGICTLSPLKRPLTICCQYRASPTQFVRKRCLSLAYTLHEHQGPEEDIKQPPIIILHGLFGSKQNNRSISKAIARDLRTKVYALDLRNHGDSPHHPDHDYPSMADDVEEFMNHHGLKKPTLIGHSMGAKTAMTVALRSPAKVAALIPVDNAPVDAVLKSDFAKYVQGMRRVADAGITRQADADKILQEFEPALSVRQFLLTNLTRNSETKKLEFRIPIKILGAALGHLGDFPYNDPSSERYCGRTLVVRGTQSHYVADDALPLIGRFFPRFELRDIPCGHWVIAEQPALFKEAVVGFLRSRE